MYGSSRGMETAIDFTYCGCCTQRDERQKVYAMSFQQCSYKEKATESCSKPTRRMLLP